MSNNKRRKQVALKLLRGYYHNPKSCGYDKEAGECMYYTSEGNTCVAGQCMKDPVSYADAGSIAYLLRSEDENHLLKPEYVGLFSIDEWAAMQRIHDNIAVPKPDVSLEKLCEQLGLFTYEELKETYPGTEGTVFKVKLSKKFNEPGYAVKTKPYRKWYLLFFQRCTFGLYKAP